MIEIKGGQLFQFGAAFIVSLFAIPDGMIMAWTSPMIPYFLSNKTHIAMTRYEAEWLESALLLGSIFALPLTGYCVETIGRKKSIALACSVLIMTWIVIAVANVVWYLYVARFCQGLGLNMAFVAIPMYVGEISDKSIRGFLSSIVSVLSVVGVVVIYTVASSAPFYVPSLIAISVLVTELVLLIFLPESPYWFVEKGRYEEAATSLRQIGKCSDIEKDLKEIMQAIENEKKEKWQLKELLLVKNYRKSILIMVILNGGQLFCGFDSILMNLHGILTAVGTEYMSPYISGTIFSSIYLFSSIISSVVIDKLGRKQLLLISASLTSLCLGIIGIYFHLQQLGFGTIAYSWIPVIVVMIYAAAFKVGVGMVPMVMTSEIFSSKIKTVGMTFSEFIYMFASILALQLFFLLRDTFGLHASFYAFGCCGILTLICVVYVVPETKGKSLEEIQQILGN